MAYGMLPPMEKTTVYLDPEVARGLRAMSRSTGRPQAHLIREAVGGDPAARRAGAPGRGGRGGVPGGLGRGWKHGPDHRLPGRAPPAGGGVITLDTSAV